MTYLNNMSDITKCTGKGCPIKKLCHRYTAKASERQAILTTPPFKIIEQKDDKIKMECDMYWGKNQEVIFDMLHRIVNGNE